jgi:hypothetical protein
VEAAGLVVIVVIVIVAVVIAIPVMVMFYPAVATFPIPGVKTLAVMARRYPMCAFIGRPSPVSFVPSIVTSIGEPITVDPEKIRPGHGWPYRYDARWRRWTNSNPH